MTNPAKKRDVKRHDPRHDDGIVTCRYAKDDTHSCVP
jgi:hypothetical protein